MLKLKDGYTVYKSEPQYGDRDEVYDVEYEAYESRLSLEDAKALVKKLTASLPAKATWSYGYAKDLEFHGYGDPARWINDSEEYDALVEAGEIMPREYRQ
jgi:hypothetical protein